MIPYLQIIETRERQMTTTFNGKTFSVKQTGNKFFYFVEDVREFALTWMGVKTEDPDPEYWRKRPAKRQVSRRSAPALLPAHAMEATV